MLRARRASATTPVRPGCAGSVAGRSVRCRTTARSSCRWVLSGEPGSQWSVDDCPMRRRILPDRTPQSVDAVRAEHGNAETGACQQGEQSVVAQQHDRLAGGLEGQCLVRGPVDVGRLPVGGGQSPAKCENSPCGKGEPLIGDGAGAMRLGQLRADLPRTEEAVHVHPHRLRCGAAPRPDDLPDQEGGHRGRVAEVLQGQHRADRAAEFEPCSIHRELVLVNQAKVERFARIAVRVLTPPHHGRGAQPVLVRTAHSQRVQRRELGAQQRILGVAALVPAEPGILQRHGDGHLPDRARAGGPDFVGDGGSDP